MKTHINNLLIVEDQPYIRDKIYEEALKIEMFHKIYKSGTLQKALNIIKNDEVHTICLDLSLPDGSGLEILSYLKENNLEKKVVVFSASPEMEKVSLRYGANYFFDKKNGLEPLVEELRNEKRT